MVGDGGSTKISFQSPDQAGGKLSARKKEKNKFSVFSYQLSARKKEKVISFQSPVQAGTKLSERKKIVFSFWI
jgi:hypothetical protein